MARINFEAAAIAPFETLAARLGHSVAKGQGAGNRLPVGGNAYFQFGDLRVDLPRSHVVLEVESAGGVTNLVKYWPCLSQGLIGRPVHLIHLFRQVSANDYRSHIDLWHFVALQMRTELGAKFSATLFTYSGRGAPQVALALQHFERLLSEGAV